MRQKLDLKKCSEQPVGGPARAIGRSGSMLRRCFAWTALSALLFFPSAAGLAGVSLQQKFDFTERLAGAIQKSALQTMRARGPVEERDILVTVGIAVDEEALALRLQEQSSSNTSDIERINELTARLREAVRAINEENIEATTSSEDSNVVIASGMRFGPLNLDVLAGERLPVRQVQPDNGRASQRSPAVILALQLPGAAGDPSAGRPRTQEIEITEFITRMTIGIVLPAGTPDTVYSDVRAAATRTLGVYVPERLVSDAEFNMSTAAGPEPKEEGANKPATMAEDPFRYITENVLDPKNPSLSGLLLALALTIGGLVGSLVIWRASGGLIAALGNLQAAQAAEGSAASGSLFASGQDSQVYAAAGGQETRLKAEAAGPFDAQAEAHALTSELDRLRHLFDEGLSHDALAMSEGLDEVLRDEQGFQLARHMYAFLGHARFEPLVKEVSPALSDGLRDHLLQMASAPVQTLSGADAVRRLLGQWNLRRVQLRGVGGGEPQQIADARKALLAVDDKVLFPWLDGNADKPPAHWIFRALTQGRRLQALRQLSPAASRTLAMGLEGPPDVKRGQADEACKVLAELQLTAPALESERSKLIRQILAQMKLSDEKILHGLLDGPDWAMRRLIAESAYLFDDLIYLEDSFLHDLIEKKKVQDKANVLYVLPVELRSRILNAYQADSRAKEVLLLELKMIETNRKRLDLITGQSESLVGEFMTQVRAELQKRPAQIDQALRAMASQKGWPPPPLQERRGSDGIGDGGGDRSAA